MSFEVLWKREIEEALDELKKELNYFNDDRLKKVAVKIVKRLFGEGDRIK